VRETILYGVYHHLVIRDVVSFSSVAAGWSDIRMDMHKTVS